MRIKTDVVIVGTGVAGMFSALKLPRDKKIVIITKEDMRSSDSFLAQGGICVLRDENDYDSYFEDTMKAGHYENRKESVDIMIRGSRDIINDLVGYGVDFKMDGDDFAYTREGAHSRPRILYHEDITGKEISEKLLQQVLKLENVTILEYTTMQDILVENGKCTGLKVVSAEANRARLEAMEAGKAVKTQEEIQPGGEIPVEIYAQDTILASGGIGGRYAHSTNYPHLTGDALDIAKKHNVRLEHLDYVQIHPTTLYSKKPGRRFLISESVRGEGAVLYNSKKERFVNELLPRDVVTNAIREEMKKEGTDHVWLSMENIDKDTILNHFPNIYQRCLEEGYDVTKECIPVVPAQHYFMGGIWWILTARPAWTSFMQWEKPAATVYMARTDWQVIPCWRALYLQNVQPKQSQQKRKVLQVRHKCSWNINIRIMKDRSSLALENRAAVIIKKEKVL